MAARKPDDIRVLLDEGEFTAFKSVEIANDFGEVASCTLSLGDDGSWSTMERHLRPGRGIRVTCNGRLCFSGRFEADAEPVSPQNGMQIQCTARTKLSDARVAGAEPGITFRNTSLKKWLIRLFQQHGYSAQDFWFDEYTERDVATGRRGTMKKPVDMDRINFDQLRVNPPETTWECASRILKFHHLMIWDGSDGRIIVGRPDDEQRPAYVFVCNRPPNDLQNNVLSIRPSRDWSEVPSEIWVHSNPYGRDIRKTPIKGAAADLDVLAEAARSGNFQRIVRIPNDGARNRGWAEASAKRELAARLKNKQVWDIDVDGWTWFDGSADPPGYAINTVVNVQSEVHPGVSGGYLVHRLLRKLDLDAGPTTTLTAVVKGAYAI